MGGQMVMYPGWRRFPLACEKQKAHPLHKVPAKTDKEGSDFCLHGSDSVGVVPLLQPTLAIQDGVSAPVRSNTQFVDVTDVWILVMP
jgi:hypothetical protein